MQPFTIFSFFQQLVLGYELQLLSYMTDVRDPLVRTLLLRFLCSIDQVGASTNKVYLYTKMVNVGHKYASSLEVGLGSFLRQ